MSWFTDIRYSPTVDAIGFQKFRLMTPKGAIDHPAIQCVAVAPAFMPEQQHDFLLVLVNILAELGVV